MPEDSEDIRVLAGAVLCTVYTTDTDSDNNRRRPTLSTVTLTMVTVLPVGNNDITADANAVRKLVESLDTPATVCVACIVTTGFTGAAVGSSVSTVLA